jgi:ubiquinone/menaquinone biosynthesis C-methylase UbiE
MGKNIDELTTYYDQRAPEYELLYQGKGPLNLDSSLYRAETVRLCKIVGKFGKGHLIDIGCGTCFWLPLYAKRCRKVTLLDGSSRMLQECKRKLDVLHLKMKCHIIHGDFFSVELPLKKYSSALIAFFLSHVPPERESMFFSTLRHVLKPHASVLMLDSVWNRTRQRYSRKEGFQQRTLTDGKTFTIYKRYFDKQDIECLKRHYRIRLETAHFGDVFFAARGEFYA